VSDSSISTGNFAELADGITLHYASCGEHGRPLALFVHGFPEYWAAWEDVLPRFADSFYAVAPDLRGFNLSSQPPEVAAYKARAIVADLAQLIAKLGYDCAHVIGHDWGGAACWQMAISLPKKVNTLSILNSPHPIPFARALANDQEQQQASAYMNWLRGPWAEKALAEDNFARMENMLRSLSRAQTGWLTEERLTRYREVWGRGLTGGLNYYRASPLYPPTTDDAGARKLKLDPNDFVVRVPTQIIWGMGDAALLPCLLDGLDELIPDLRIERLERATHWLVHEEPQLVADLLREFFDSH